MMARRAFLRLLVPAALIGLVAVLAALQYRWLGQVSDAERAQLSRSLTQRAREMSADFDAELSRLFESLRLTPDAVTSSSWNAFAADLARWRETSRFPQMLGNLYLVVPGEGGYVVRPWDPATKAFATALPSWPASLQPARALLGDEAHPAVPLPAGRLQVVTIAMAPVVNEIPALLVPVPNPSAPAAASVWATGGPRSYVIAELDRAYLATTVLPGLAEKHFPSTGEGTTRLAVLASDGTRVFAHGVPADGPIDEQHADVVVPIFTVSISVRSVLGAAAAAGPGGRSVEAGAAAPPGTPAVSRFSVIVEQQTTPATGEPALPGLLAGKPGSGQIRLASRGAWRLVLQHGAGSLDAAVTQARRRNLALSFGILAVLAAGVVLVVVNARRTEQIAARQMDFVATVSHELRTPLAVIRSAAQNLAAGVVAEPTQARRYGSLIEDEGRRLTDMVEQVMAYAGLEGSRRVHAPRPVDVQALVDQAVDACRPACEAAGCVLEADLGPDTAVPPVAGDETALGHVVRNLLSNAAKHGADGRWIGVAVSVCDVRDRREVQITVSDRGRGIEAADLAHVFEPFRRGRRAIAQQVHGNGLGLSLVKRIVEAHGGRVAVTSAPGDGATFVVYLPAMPAAAGSDGAGGA
jgi:signal transduction histidine kinase